MFFILNLCTSKVYSTTCTYIKYTERCLLKQVDFGHI